MIAVLCSAPRVRARALLAAFPVLLKEQVRREIYRNYTAEAARLLVENVARLSSGSYLQARYEDLVSFKPEETRTEEEIIAQVRRALGGGQAESV